MLRRLEGNVLPRAVGRGSRVGLDLLGSHIFSDAAVSWDSKEWLFETFKGDPY